MEGSGPVSGLSLIQAEPEESEFVKCSLGVQYVLRRFGTKRETLLHQFQGSCLPEGNFRVGDDTLAILF